MLLAGSIRGSTAIECVLELLGHASFSTVPRMQALRPAIKQTRWSLHLAHAACIFTSSRQDAGDESRGDFWSVCVGCRPQHSRLYWLCASFVHQGVETGEGCLASRGSRETIE